jgi:NAD(P)-dependent dehydrogenase (short-subunit alcohol dehydrogenase family)
MGRLDGKTAIVTGASRGIGRAIALELAQEGAKVALNYVSSDARAQEVADEVASFGGACMLAKANVANPQEARAMVKRVAEQFGRIDILVNNAGITRDKSLRKMIDEDWLEVVQANLNAVFFCTSAAIPIMIEQNYGRIINISSMNGQTGAFGQANYGASKGGIIAFTKTCAIELAKYNITVNAICPGFTMTDMLAKVPANIQDQIKARIPLGRFGTPEDMAKAATFLVEGGDYITGQQININGGAYM